MPSDVIAVYPGTFDPMTLGHEDVVRRACQLFGRLIVGVALGEERVDELVPRRILVDVGEFVGDQVARDGVRHPGDEIAGETNLMAVPFNDRHR